MDENTGATLNPKENPKKPVCNISVERRAYFLFMHAFGNGRRSYAPEPIAKRTKRHRHHVDICNHVMQSYCLAHSLLGELRQHFAD